MAFGKRMRGWLSGWFKGVSNNDTSTRGKTIKSGLDVESILKV